MFFLHIDIVFEQDDILLFSVLVAFCEPIQNTVNTYYKNVKYILQ